LTARTAQSLTAYYNVQILSHFLIPYLLLSSSKPILGKGAQICNIARPGEKNRNIDLEDFRCLKAFEAGKFSPMGDTLKFVFQMDLYTQASMSDNISTFTTVYLAQQEFNIRFPDTHTTHIFPGVVATSMFSHPTVPWYVRVLFFVGLPFVSRSPAQYADVVVWEIASDEGKSLTRAFWDQYGREVVVDERVKADSQLRESIWENMLQLSEVS
jgi:hypothetical protein